MREKEYSYFWGCIDTVSESSESGKNVILIRHNNALQLKKEELGQIGIFHRFQNDTVRKPYEPFLGIIKDYVKNKVEVSKEFSVKQFMRQAGVYPIHREILESYFVKGRCERTEELILGEYSYEKDKFLHAVLDMLYEISKRRPLLIILDEINLAGSSALEILKSISKERKYHNIKIVAVLNSAGEVLSFADEKLKEFTEYCEETEKVYHWIFEGERKQTGELKETEETSSVIDVHVLEDLLITLEYEQAGYYIQNLLKEIEKEKLALEPEIERKLVKMNFEVSLAAEQYADALLACDTLAKLPMQGEELQLESTYMKTLVYMYSGDEAQLKEGILKCEKAAEKLGNAKWRFRVALLENMAQYSGWRNLWICEHDTPVADFLIEECLKYGYTNHLAHIYVYSYNGDYRNFMTIEGMEERIPEFYQGVAMAEELQNTKFLVEAYRKNVMIASIHGYFNICIYFYQKILKIVRNKDEVAEAGIYNGLGYSNCGLEHYEEANGYYNKALILYYKYEMQDEIVETFYNLGINAMLAKDYYNAGSYLLAADSILRTLKQTTMKTCNISKLFGLISLSFFRQGAMYQTQLYLNKAKQFLAYFFGKENEENEYYADDSMFLVYLVSGLTKKREKEWKEAKQDFERAEFYMRRSTGSLFLNYPEFAFDRYKLYLHMGNVQEAKQGMEEFRNFCRENHYAYREQKIKEFLGEPIQGGKILYGSMDLGGISQKEIFEMIKRKWSEKEKDSKARTIRFFHVIQKYTKKMTGNIREEAESILPVFKNNFYIDNVFMIRCHSGENEVVYSDLGYEVSREAVDYIVDYFQKKPGSFVVSKDGMEHEEYDHILSLFDSERIFSFAAVPILENGQLISVFFAYINIKNSWTSSNDHSILGQEDLEIFTYVFSQISNAFEKLEVNRELLEANEKLKEQMTQLVELKNQAEVANEAKSNFLANMSHEIRTPMNAIIGMAEIALRGELTLEQKNTIEQIRSSGKTLLSIINDVLDFSKIESGKMDIIEEKYQPMSIVNDIVNIINTRIGDKPVEFITDIAPDLPYELLGDSIRIKQIIINIANNAVKFTKEGAVTLRISYVPLQPGKIELHIAVEDTGIGIKKEDLGKLFQSFQQVDSKRNRNIEGTGLGLSISKQLLQLMGGNILVESEYGKGSIFTCTVPQSVVTDIKSIQVKEAKRGKTLSLVSNSYVEAQLQKDIKRLGMEYEGCQQEEKLLEKLEPAVKYLFVEEGLCSEKIITTLKEQSQLQCIVLANFRSVTSYEAENITVMKKPLYSFPIGRFFNGEELYGYEFEEEEEQLDFEAPKAKVLIVDDNSVNLTVSKGLLKPLRMEIHTAESGKEALEKVAKTDYDIVFMDHMMPEMDGVETTHKIRESGKTCEMLPIIALTANAVSGTRDMFLQEGMNDFVAKPIEFKVMVAKLKKWLPKYKIEKISEPIEVNGDGKRAEAPQIPGLDTRYALELLGDETLFWSVIEDYYRLIEKKHRLIKEYEETEDWKAYTIEVHALKSASRQIGALELAEKAARMEQAGREEDSILIHQCTDQMLAEYLAWKEVFSGYFIEEEENSEKEQISKEMLSTLFAELKEALENLDLNGMDEVVAKMSDYGYPPEWQELYQKLKNAVEEIDSETCQEILGLWESQLY